MKNKKEIASLLSEYQELENQTKDLTLAIDLTNLSKLDIMNKIKTCLSDTIDRHHGVTYNKSKTDNVLHLNNNNANK
jgi:hypothetical protein|tara:strand:+ start:2159 stop:2389 length:231 start_codon:yes stop_codon:yes gene_type:complete